MDLTADIKNEINVALERIGADPILVAIVASWRDARSDAETLEHLRDWNNGTFRWARITGVERDAPTLKRVK